ncbi:cyclic nucleotide-binding domain protein (macronuclear) [Tetrahymena thermophila SB210]|uniref:Cyclic nucleotide-binding domain protein n=1 Tax=Tetrahymena thermophila (strain SB210) TaxID=312017 RepID=I7M052_TETTS|nr:cyclic nucleotide-binding domain protein [Tetrahymena thermophila SB210]EAR85501.2 cyclic nucleotide-binding domain protein [Tetrahymena thermophila SB210]|eukprot:XP_001033164.2 cyclic nucleotide-binding domain protein [Tetrahymena thermophila SB210]
MLPQSILDHIINNTNISKVRAISNSFQKLNSKSQCSQSFNKEDNCDVPNNKESQIDDQNPEILFKENVSLQNQEDALMVVSILRKQIKNKLEITFVKKALENLDIWKNQVNLFNQGSSFNNSIFSHMKVQYCQKGEVIFNYGDQGSIYYIVAQGSFSCLIPKSMKQQKQTDDQLNQEQRQNMLKNMSVVQEKSKEIVVNPLEELIPISQYVKPSEKQKVIQEETISEFHSLSKKKIIQDFKQENIDEDKIYKQNFPSFTKIKVYTPGESFGEIALLTMQKERKATIISREDGILITLDKSKFDKILNIFKELKIRNSLDFLHRFSFLNELGPTKLLSLLHCTEIIKFQKSNIIYKEGDKAENIFFIRQGVIMLTKLGEIIDDKLVEQRQQEIDENQSLDLNKVKKNQAISQSQIRVQLVVYKENSFFGEDEIMQDLAMRNTKAEVSSFEAEIYIISKQRLFDYLKGSNVYNILVQEYEVKQKWRIQQYKNIINMKQNTINQYNIKMKQILGEEYRQAYINRINSQLLQTELNKSKAPTSSQKFQKPLVNNFIKEINLQKKQSSVLNKSQSSSQEENQVEEILNQKAEQLETPNSSIIAKQNKQEQQNENKKDFIQIDEYFQSQDTENISSPLHQTFRIPPELSEYSLNQILEERFQHKQMVLNQSEKKGKPSNFFIIIDPHQRKQQDLDIFKLKKEKTKPFFQKQFQKKRLQNLEQNNKSHQSDKKLFAEQIEDFSQIFNMSRQESQNAQQNIDQAKNNFFEISNDEKQNFTSMSLDCKQSSNKQKSNTSSNDEIKLHRQCQGQSSYSVRSNKI